MDDKEMDSKLIINFFELQAAEGKSAKEAIEALMALLGAKMPEFKNE